jgi:hypothetical protein
MHARLRMCIFFLYLCSEIGKKLLFPSVLFDSLAVIVYVERKRKSTCDDVQVLVIQLRSL